MKINEWLVNKQLKVVDSGAVKAANSRANAMMDVAGLAGDPVAAIAKRAQDAEANGSVNSIVYFE